MPLRSVTLFELLMLRMPGITESLVTPADAAAQSCQCIHHSRYLTTLLRVSGMLQRLFTACNSTRHRYGDPAPNRMQPMSSMSGSGFSGRFPTIRRFVAHER